MQQSGPNLAIGDVRFLLGITEDSSSPDVRTASLERGM
jgi:hypothetical protein